MIDREKVIKGLECLTEVAGKRCGLCPYKGDEAGIECFTRMAEDAIALLKAQKTAVWEYYVNDEGKARWRCGGCGKICRRDPRDKKYCSTCGAIMRMEA